tara:strand:+ start:472 stop:819 length:348 start_codon:yes stop_codon:yes gene_type:complete
MNIDLKFVARVLLASMFLLSVSKSVMGGFPGSVNFIKSKNLPFPLVLAIAGFAIKAFGSYSLLTNKHKKVAIPLLILFVATVIVVFNNPLVDESKLWMCMALLGVIGGLILALKD